MAHTSCGIDFGTSNSALAAVTAGGVRLVPLEGTRVMIPSAVFFNTDQNYTAFGQRALQDYLDGYSGRYMRSLKSILGSDLMKEKTQIGNKTMGFPEIIGLFFKNLKETAERNLETEINNVVIGRPVHFVDNDESADKRAENELHAIAKNTGFTNIIFEYEPLAAARDYESRLDKEELVLVIDIGGGTSDFSVIRLSPAARKKEHRTNDILANAGIHIGGTDFDKKFSLHSFMPGLGYQSPMINDLTMPLTPYHTLATWHLINGLYNQKNKNAVKDLYTHALRRDLVGRLMNVIENQRGHELATTVEAAKINLSEQESIEINMDFIDPDWTLDLDLIDLTNAVEDQLTAVIATAQETVTDQANLKPSDIDTIFMTGGSTALSGFEEKVRTAFPDARINYGDRFSSVAAGLGLYALQKYGTSSSP